MFQPAVHFSWFFVFWFFCFFVLKINSSSSLILMVLVTMSWLLDGPLYTWLDQINKKIVFLGVSAKSNLPCLFVVCVCGWALLYVHRNHRLTKDGAQDNHLDFHPAPEVWPPGRGFLSLVLGWYFLTIVCWWPLTAEQCLTKVIGSPPGSDFDNPSALCLALWAKNQVPRWGCGWWWGWDWCTLFMKAVGLSLSLWLDLFTVTWLTGCKMPVLTVLYS